MSRSFSRRKAHHNWQFRRAHQALLSLEAIFTDSEERVRRRLAADGPSLGIFLRRNDHWTTDRLLREAVIERRV